MHISNVFALRCEITQRKLNCVRVGVLVRWTRGTCASPHVIDIGCRVTRYGAGLLAGVSGGMQRYGGTWMKLHCECSQRRNVMATRLVKLMTVAVR
jgi:hypothetical protein